VGHQFNSLFSRTTWVSRHRKRKPFWILLEQEIMGVAVASAVLQLYLLENQKEKEKK